jgi:hypothetical protein
MCIDSLLRTHFR